jgi:hypothetical protein
VVPDSLRVRRAPRRPVVAALLTPLVYAGYLVPFGVTGLGRDALPTAVVVLCLLYVLPLAALGAGLVFAIDRGRGLRAAPLVAVGGLSLLPFTMPAGLDSLPRSGIAVSMLVVGSALLGSAEYALRNRQRVLARFSTVAVTSAVVVGVGHATVVLWVASQSDEAVVDALGLWLIWGGAGMAALGAVPTLLLLRWSLVTPGVVVVVLTVNTVRTDLFAAPVDAVTPFSLVVWFLVLPLVVALGAVEYHGRRRLGVCRPRSLVGGIK